MQDGVSIVWMVFVLTVVNMENFITGYTGHEYQLRAELKRRLGVEKYEIFFDKVTTDNVADLG